MEIRKFKLCFIGAFLLQAFVALAVAGDGMQNSPINRDSAQNNAVKLNYEKLRSTDSEYARAMDLYSRHRHFDALPMLESLVQRYPSDPTVTQRLGICLIMTSASLQDEGDRKKQRARARKLLLRSKELGMDDNFIEYYTSVIPEDGGGDVIFSNRKEVNTAMKEGEAAFGRGDYAAAIESYTRAMEADPTLYPAVLFIGDSYFALGQNETAVEWFERATRVNPHLEEGYRYWGDALTRLGRMEDARSKYIEAIIAEPYKRQTWVGINQWVSRNRLRAAVPDIKRPKRPEASGNPAEGAKITLDANSVMGQTPKDGTGAWMIYQITTGAWQAQLFRERFPNEKEYRHTLVEEKEALGLVASNVNEEIGKGMLKTEELDSGIATLIKLHKAGLLEPYILINLADKGIAQDYAAYRKANREKLRQYLDEFVVPKIAAK